MFMTPSADLYGFYQMFNGFQMKYNVEFTPKKLFDKYGSECCHEMGQLISLSFTNKKYFLLMS